MGQDEYEPDLDFADEDVEQDEADFDEEGEPLDLESDLEDEEPESKGVDKYGRPQPLKPWMAQLPDRFKADERLAAFDSFGELAESWESLQARVLELEEAQGEQPEQPEGAPEIPATPEDYQVEVPRAPAFMSQPHYLQMRTGLKAYLEGTAGEIREIAHELKLPNAVAQRIVELFAAKHYEAVRASVEHQKDLQAKGLEILKKDWRGDFESNQELARRAVATFGGPEIVKELAGGGFANNPGLIKLFANIGRAIGEDTLVPARGRPTAETAGSSGSAGPDLAALKKRYPSMAKGVGG